MKPQETRQKDLVIRFLEELITLIPVTKKRQSFYVSLESENGDVHSFSVSCLYTRKVPVKGRKWRITKEVY